MLATTLLLLLLNQLQAGGCWQHPPSLFLAVRGRGSRVGGSDGKTFLASSHSIDESITQTDVDASLHQTLQRLGVQGIASPTNNARGVSVCTTPKSVAGRGAFWSPSAIMATDIQKETSSTVEGDVLAFIPKSSILTLSNPASLSSSNSDDKEPLMQLEEFSSLSSKSSWPVAFTMYVVHVALQNEIFREWIESFMGPDPPIRPPMERDSSNASENWTSTSNTSENEELYEEAVHNLMSMAHIYQETAREAMVARYNTYAQDWRSAQEWTSNKSKDCATAQINLDESKFAELYSILISRTANLGPTYQEDSESERPVAVRGVIPLHDMINHPPPDVEHNVELFTVGDLRELMPEESVRQLVGKVLFQHDSILDDRDVLLVARCQILPGDELFVSYRNNRRRPMVDEKERAWNTLQYGFLIQ